MLRLAFSCQAPDATGVLQIAACAVCHRRCLFLLVSSYPLLASDLCLGEKRAGQLKRFVDSEQFFDPFTLNISYWQHFDGRIFLEGQSSFGALV